MKLSVFYYRLVNNRTSLYRDDLEVESDEELKEELDALEEDGYTVQAILEEHKSGQAGQRQSRS